MAESSKGGSLSSFKPASSVLIGSLVTVGLLRKNGPRLSSRPSQVGLIQGSLLASLFFTFLALPFPQRDFSLFVVAYVLFPFFALLFLNRAWLIFLFLLPIFDLAPSVYGMDKLPVYRVILLGLGLWFFLLYPKGISFWRKLAHSPVFVAWILFVAANLASAIYAQNIEAVFRTLTYFEPLFFFLLTYYLVGRGLISLRAFLRTALAAGVLVGAIGLAEMISQISLKSLFDLPALRAAIFLMSENRFGLGGRISSTISHPVYAGQYFLIIMVLFIYYISIYAPRRKAFLAGIIPFFILLILGTGTRAVMLALLTGALSLVVFTGQKKKVWIPVVAAAVVTAIGLSLILPQIPRYLERSVQLDTATVETSNIRDRVRLATVFFNIFRENRILGRGPGLIQKEASGLTPGQLEGLSGIENQYLVILADGGFLSGLAYLLFMFGIFHWTSGLIRSRLSAEVRAGGLSLAVMFVSYFTFVVSETCLTLTPFFLLMAVGGAIAGKADQEIEGLSTARPPGASSGAEARPG